MSKCAFIGVGNMGSALLRGVVASKLYPVKAIAIFDPHTPTQAALVEALGVHGAASMEEACEGAELILFAVKPPQMTQCFAALKPSTTLAISVAAGVGLEELHAAAPPGVIPVRAMPNTPALVQKGMTTYCVRFPTTEVCAKVEAFFGGVGQVLRLEEAEMDSAMAIAGCGPAYVFRFVEALAEAGKTMGLNPEQAMRLARETLIGGARLLEQSPESASTLRQRVTSPGGTTAEGLKVLDGHGPSGIDLDNLVSEAARAAAEHGGRMRARLCEARQKGEG